MSGVWVTDPDTTDTLILLTTSGVASGWEYRNGDDVVETYDVSGKLLSLRDKAGLLQTLAYNAGGRLGTVTDAFGKTFTLSYDTSDRLASITLPSGSTIAYTYDAVANLATVTHADGKIRTYHYNESGQTSGANLPKALTGITDENSVRYATYGYAATGQAISTNHASIADQVSVTYGTGTASVTDALAQTRTYSFAATNGANLNGAISGALCPTCGPAARTYDSAGFPASKTDWNGNRTNYVYNARGLETQRVEGLTSAGATTTVTRTVTTDWDANYRLLTRIAEPNRITTMAYGSPTDVSPGNRGNLLTKTLQATTDANGSLAFTAALTGAARTWTYTYNGNGQALTVNGPRTDVADVTTYTYYANAATCTVTVAGASTIGCRGQINTISNALAHLTTINEYNAHGQPLKITDPNGLVTTLAYDARMRLASRNVGGEITSYTYDNAGQLTKVTMPDASFLAYTYDAAHRLTQIADNLGNRIVYTLNAMGSRTKEDVFDPLNALAQTRSRVYSSLNRLQQEIGAAGQTTAYGYDNQGNVTSVDGPLTGAVDVTTNTYDALNRLARVTDPAAGQVNYGYDGRDQLTSVTDPRTLNTTYTYDGLGNLNQQLSPDTGATANTYDAAGNLLTATDAKGQQTRYTYDALNRAAKVEYLSGSPLAIVATHTYTYDGGTNQKGRLTTLAESNTGITTTYVYDVQGRLTGETRTINAVAYTTSYGYDAQGRLSSVTYPGGRQLNYAFDTLGRVQSVTSVKSGVTQTVVSGITYRPFGPPKGFTFGNGQTYARGFDNDGRIASYTLATQTMAVGYDVASRIQSLAQSGVPASNQTYGYDALDRLTSFVAPSVNQGFTYDADGNRASKTVAATSATYTYPSTSNRLTQVGTGPVRTYDANGANAFDGVNTFTYDVRGRMARASNAAGASDYQLNALGQRIRKTNPQGDTVYHYDAQGRLIAESSTAGAIQKEYVYLGDQPVAVLQ